MRAGVDVGTMVGSGRGQDCTFRLPLTFAQQQTGKQPFQRDIDDLDAPLISAFLNRLGED